MCVCVCGHRPGNLLCEVIDLLKTNDHVVIISMDLSKGPSINDVTHLGGEGGRKFVTMCDMGEGGVSEV